MEQSRIFDQTERLEQAILGMFQRGGEIDSAAHARALAEVRKLLMLLNPPATRRSNPAFLVPGGITYGGQAGVGAVASSFAAAFGNPPKRKTKRRRASDAAKLEEGRKARAHASHWKGRPLSKLSKRTAVCTCGGTARCVMTTKRGNVYRCGSCGLELVDRKPTKALRARLKKALAKKR